MLKNSGTAVYGFMYGSVPCNASLGELMDEIRPKLREAVENVNTVSFTRNCKFYISINVFQFISFPFLGENVDHSADSSYRRREQFRRWHSGGNACGGAQRRRRSRLVPRSDEQILHQQRQAHHQGWIIFFRILFQPAFNVQFLENLFRL